MLTTVLLCMVQYGFTLLPEEQREAADLWLVNTCTVKSPSQSAMDNVISAGRQLGKHLVVAGCVPQGESITTGGLPYTAHVMVTQAWIATAKVFLRRRPSCQSAGRPQRHRCVVCALYMGMLHVCCQGWMLSLTLPVPVSRHLADRQDCGSCRGDAERQHDSHAG